MCAIAGIRGENIGKKLKKMLLTLKHRGPDFSGVYVDGEVAYGDLDHLVVPDGYFGIGHNLLSIVGSDVVQPLTHEDMGLICNGEIYNHQVLRKTISYDFQTNSDSEVILGLIDKYKKASLVDTLPFVLKDLQGDYSFAIYDGKDLVAVRDPLGVKPLYIGGDEEIFGFASERKALWAVGIEEVTTLAPGFMLLNQEVVRLPGDLRLGNETFLNATWSLGNNYSKDVLRRRLRALIVDSVNKRTHELEKVGVLFSGGVDSSLLAQICVDLGVDTELYCVGSKESPDVKFAQMMADDMGLPLYIKKIDVDLVRECTPLVLNATEEWNLMKLGVGMTAYLAADMAQENGLRVMLSGQGADELFAGYHRYLGFYQEKGEDAQKYLWKDVKNLYHVNLERDDAVTMAHGVEMRVPYLDLPIISMAMNIPMSYKIKDDHDRLRKCILREVAAEVGVNSEVLMRPKKAAQYGSGIHKILVKKVLKDPKYVDELKNSLKLMKIDA
jgi:asparagine synthase (glutamine-hydrolysing)